MRPDDSFINDKQKSNLCVRTVSFARSRGEVDSSYPKYHESRERDQWLSGKYLGSVPGYKCLLNETIVGTTWQLFS